LRQINNAERDYYIIGWSMWKLARFLILEIIMSLTWN